MYLIREQVIDRLVAVLKEPSLLERLNVIPGGAGITEALAALEKEIRPERKR